MHIRILLFLVIFPTVLFAQTKKVPATVMNPEFLYSSYDFEADEAALKPEIIAQAGKNTLSNILLYGVESGWPKGMQTLDSRLQNREVISSYKVYKIVATSQFCILLVPAAENSKMIPDFAPKHDIYFVMELMGADFEGNRVEKQPELYPEPSAEYDEDYPEIEEIIVKIDNPGDLYSAFKLGDNSSAKSILLESGILSDEQFQVIADRCNENGWPAGIATMKARLAVPELIREYVAYYMIELGENAEYTLIWIPQEENQHMPENMRPLDAEGMYFVMKSSGISY